MYLKLSDVKEVHLCAIVWFVIVLRDVCEEQKMWWILDFSGVKAFTVWKECVYLTHGGEELGHPVWIALLAGCEDPEQAFKTQVGQAGALLLLPCVLHDAGDVGVTPHQHTGVTKAQRRISDWSEKNRNTVQLCTISQGTPTLSCHRGSGKFCLCSVHLDRRCVQFPPAAGSSVQPHLMHNAQILHLSEGLRAPPLCSEYCLWKQNKNQHFSSNSYV